MNPSTVLRTTKAVKTLVSKSRSKLEVLKESRQIILSNVPRTATPADIRREINKAGLRGVSDVAIDYEYFKPTERAVLTLVSSHYIEPNLQSLKNFSISGIPIKSDYYPANVQKQQRMRGYEGRLEAANRGALTGNGPNAGITSNECVVTIAGLPPKVRVEDMERMLQDYNLAESQKGSLHIIKLPIPYGKFSMTCRFLVTLASVPEAHRLVRNLHATYLKSFGEENLISAHIIN